MAGYIPPSQGGDAGLGWNGQQGFHPPPPGYAQPAYVQPIPVQPILVQPMYAQPMYGQQGPVHYGCGYQGGLGQQVAHGLSGSGQQGCFGLQGYGQHALGQSGFVHPNSGQQAVIHQGLGQHGLGHQGPNQHRGRSRRHKRTKRGGHREQRRSLHAGRRGDDHENGTGQARQGDEYNWIDLPIIFRITQPLPRAAMDAADDAAPAEERRVPNVSDNQSAGGPQHHAPVQAVQQHQDDDGEAGLDGPQMWDYGRHTLEWRRFVVILRKSAEDVGESVTFEAPKDGKGPVVNVGPKIFARCQKYPYFRTIWQGDSE